MVCLVAHQAVGMSSRGNCGGIFIGRPTGHLTDDVFTASCLVLIKADSAELRRLWVQINGIGQVAFTNALLILADV